MTAVQYETSEILIDRVSDWLKTASLRNTDLETVVRGCCERLAATGIPLKRIHISLSMLHPLYRAMGFTWRRGEGLKVEFMLADCTHRVAVRYEGLLPDLFREGQGIVADGALGPDRVFVAHEVLAKHDENYMPPQVAESMKTPAGHSCAPFKPVTTS